MYIPNNYKVVCDKPNIKQINKNVLTNITNIIDYYFSDKILFNKEDYSVYSFDEFQTNTYAGQDIFCNIFIELKSQKNIKTNEIKKEKLLNKLFKNKNNDNIIPPDLFLELKEIKNNLFELFINSFDENNLIWKYKYGLKVACNVIHESQTFNYYYNIIPCVTYTNKNNEQGIMFYNDDKYDIEILYPKQYLKNFKKKNKQTNNLYTDTIKIFKNIFMEEKKELSVPFEIFETMLYNVPNELFTSLKISDLCRIINHLRNKNLNQFITIDEQDIAFTCKYKTMSAIFFKHSLKVIENFLKKNL